MCGILDLLKLESGGFAEFDPIFGQFRGFGHVGLFVSRENRKRLLQCAGAPRNRFFCCT